MFPNITELFPTVVALQRIQPDHMTTVADGKSSLCQIYTTTFMHNPVWSEVTYSVSVMARHRSTYNSIIHGCTVCIILFHTVLFDMYTFIVKEIIGGTVIHTKHRCASEEQISTHTSHTHIHVYIHTNTNTRHTHTHTHI